MHTDGTSHDWTTSDGELPISEYYYPKTLTTLITYWGEHETNPCLRARGNQLSEQVYPNIKEPFNLDSTLGGEGWKDSYLDQFRCEQEQPSEYTLTKKTLWLTAINGILPLLGISDFFDMTGGIDFIGNIAEGTIFAAAWALMSQVLFTPKQLDKLFGIPECYLDEEGGEGDDCIRGFFRNYCKYNNDFSSHNNLFQHYGLPDPYYTCDCDDCQNDQTTNEIYYSDQQIADSNLDGYSTVRPRNLVSVDPSFGKLTDLFTVGNQLYAHTTDQIAVLQYGRTTLPSNTGDIILGQGGLLGSPQGLMESAEEGYAGLISPQHAINTQYGRFFLDYEARKVYQYTQGGLKEISRKGMFNFFKEHTEYCESSQCTNEQEGLHYSLGVDPRLNRFLITKSDGCGSWTLSYDLEREIWISFHSYIPQSYIWDRDHMYAIKDGFWKHDDYCKYQTFYGTYYPHIIEFNSNHDTTYPFNWNNFTFNTEARQCLGGYEDWLYDRDITFNQLGLWNSWQTTGLHNLNARSDSRDCVDCHENNAHAKTKSNTNNPEIVRENKEWRFNETFDFTYDHKSPILSKSCDCHPYKDLINYEQCKEIFKQDYKNRIVFNNYLSTRLIFSNFDNIKLYSKYSTHHIEQQSR